MTERDESVVPVNVGGIISIIKVIPVECPSVSWRRNIWVASPVISDQLTYGIPSSVAPEMISHVNVILIHVL